jgi:hypothetical protein
VGTNSESGDKFKPRRTTFNMGGAFSFNVKEREDKTTKRERQDNKEGKTRQQRGKDKTTKQRLLEMVRSLDSLNRMGRLRMDRLLSNLGLCTRKDALVWAKQHRLTCDGVSVRWPLPSAVIGCPLLEFSQSLFDFLQIGWSVGESRECQNQRGGASLWPSSAHNPPPQTPRLCVLTRQW